MDFEPMIISLEQARVTPRGVLEVSGWAAGYAAVEEIRIAVGDAALGAPERGRRRPDVLSAHPQFVNAGESGFLLSSEIDELALRHPEVQVEVRLRGGVIRTARRAIVLPKVIRRAQPDAQKLSYHCENASLRADGRVSIEGWAASPEIVVRIGVLLDDQPIGEAALGRARPDVGNAHPTLPSARHSGFSFKTSLGGAYSGEHLLELVVETETGARHRVPLPVLAQPGAAEAEAEAPADDLDGRLRLHVDAPQVVDGEVVEPVTGMMTISGWALAKAGVVSVDVYLDQSPAGRAYYGMRRMDIAKAFPDWEGALLSGYAINLPKKLFTADSHTVGVVVSDKSGASRRTQFKIRVEKSADDDASGRIREKMRDNEIRFKTDIVASASVRPYFVIGLLVADESRLETERATATLASLYTQAYPDFEVTFLNRATDRFSLRARRSHDRDGPDWLAWTDEAAIRDARATLPHEEGRSTFVTLLRAGDRLGVDALLEFALELATHPEADFVYGDERRPDPATHASAPFYKPEWSPDLMLTTNYVGRPWCARADLFAQVQTNWREVAERGEYDLALCLTERARAIRRVPAILCERPEGVGDGGAQEATALTRALQRNDVAGEILAGCLPGVYRVKREVRTDGLVSIIIPTIAAKGLIAPLIASIRKLTRYPRYEIVCIDNIVDVHSEWKPWLRAHAECVVELLEPFNWSRFNNIGASAARGKYLLFLNDDVEVLDPLWLDALVEHSQRAEVGVVGPQLLYPDRRVQHAGMFLQGAIGRHAFHLAQENEPGPFGLALSQRNVIAVTGACLMTRRDAYEAVGGFDESHSVVNNDLDYCLRCWDRGLRVVYTPHTRLIHHEQASRSTLDDTYDDTKFDADWRRRSVRGDPFFHPRLAPDDNNYVADPEPAELVTVGHPLLARDSVRRILVQKLDHIGDFITALPAIRRLQQRFPQAEIHLLAAKASVALAPLEPVIVNAIEFNLFHAVSSQGELEKTKEELKELELTLAPYRFDIAIDLRKHGNTRNILKHSGARLLAGFDHRNQHGWLDVALEWEGDPRLVQKRLNVADDYLSLVEMVSAACEPEREAVAYKSRAEAIETLRGSPAFVGLSPALFDRPFVCLHPAAGNLNKQWPPDYFAGLVDLVVAAADVNVLVIGAETERPIAEAVIAAVQAKDRVWSVVGKTRIAELPDIVCASILFIGNDSGPKHVAAALGAPTIGIHSGVVDATEWGPLGPRAVGVQRRMSCAPCYLEEASDCHRNLACLKGLKPASVFRVCEQFLKAE